MGHNLPVIGIVSSFQLVLVLTAKQNGMSMTSNEPSPARKLPNPERGYALHANVWF